MTSPAPDRLIVPCPVDGSLNAVPADRLEQQPRCGRCHAPLFTGAPIALTEANFDRHAGKGDLPLLVDFWAAWCGPCRTMAPQFEAAAARLEPRVRLGKLDTEAAPAIAARFAVRSIPTLILLRGGREIARTAGAMPSSAIVQWTEQQLARA